MYHNNRDVSYVSAVIILNAALFICSLRLIFNERVMSIRYVRSVEDSRKPGMSRYSQPTRWLPLRTSRKRRSQGKVYT